MPKPWPVQKRHFQKWSRPGSQAGTPSPLPKQVNDESPESPADKAVRPRHQTSSSSVCWSGDTRVAVPETCWRSQGQVPRASSVGAPLFMQPTAKAKGLPRPKQMQPSGECTRPMLVKEEPGSAKDEARPTGKRDFPTLQQLEKAKGLTFGRKAPKDEFIIFLERYLARSAAEGVDYEYSTSRSGGRFFCSLRVWAWSDTKVYRGTPAQYLSQAEVAAARAFLADPDVIRAAARLPPPLVMVRKHFWGMICEAHPDLGSDRRTILQKEAVNKYLRECYDSGCSNAIADGIS